MRKFIQLNKNPEYQTMLIN